MKLTKPWLELKTFFLAGAILWTLFISYLSLTQVQMLPKFEVQNIDKGVHFVFHFVFTISWYLSLASWTRWGSKALFRVVLLSFLYGVFIELCQGLWTDYRSADPMDVLANTVGALTAALLVALVQKRHKLIR